MKVLVIGASLLLCLLDQASAAVQVNIKDPKSVKDAAGTIAYGLMKFYTGNNTGDVPGNLPAPYYWWEAGGMFGTMIDYWFITQDTTYNDVIMQAMLHQAGDVGDFMPQNQTLTEGNDDQVFWALAAMSAAENVFPNPPSDKPQWLSLAQAVFNQYVSRWDTENCNGGLRWQINSFNKGWDYKNTVANGGFFDLAARLARYTGNTTYADWAEKVWDWETATGLVTKQYEIYDGVPISTDKTCSKIVTTQWSYNAGLHLHGAATMYNITSKAMWKNAVDGLLKETKSKFLKDGVVYEYRCEPWHTCDLNGLSFKGYLIRWLAGTTQMAPYTGNDIIPIINATAEAAASSCIGPASGEFKGIDGTGCGFAWVPKGKYDGLAGVGPQMDSLSAVMYTMLETNSTPATAKSGGTSKGDPGGGNSGSTKSSQRDKETKPTTAGRVGAAFLTIILISTALGSTAILIL